MTATHPIINYSRRVLWVVTGSEKAGVSPGDIDSGWPDSPRSALVIAVRAAAQQLEGDRGQNKQAIRSEKS
jgi:hypothetical protein